VKFRSSERNINELGRQPCGSQISVDALNDDRLSGGKILQRQVMCELVRRVCGCSECNSSSDKTTVVEEVGPAAKKFVCIGRSSELEVGEQSGYQCEVR
jgi:hypothetical protein